MHIWYRGFRVQDFYGFSELFLNFIYLLFYFMIFLHRVYIKYLILSENILQMGIPVTESNCSWHKKISNQVIFFWLVNCIREYTDYLRMCFKNNLFTICLSFHSFLILNPNFRYVSTLEKFAATFWTNLKYLKRHSIQSGWCLEMVWGPTYGKNFKKGFKFLL